MISALKTVPVCAGRSLPAKHNWKTTHSNLICVEIELQLPLLAWVSNYEILHHTAAVWSATESDDRTESCLQHILSRDSGVALMWVSCHSFCAVIPAVTCCRKFRMVSFQSNSLWVKKQRGSDDEHRLLTSAIMTTTRANIPDVLYKLHVMCK